MTGKVLSIDESVAQHPRLRARFEEILSIIEGENRGPDTADSVEEKTVLEVRKLGQGVIRDWAEHKVKKEVGEYQSSHPRAREHKKSSVGTRPLAGSRCRRPCLKNLKNQSGLL